ncbi:hypothetical protein N185_32320 [Sinorhizobium sp. GW3]|nr:hypothetical protein N185_32320 [Sinorhizobium sp. GW3]
MSVYDAVLIGGGHNSLACAAHLVRRGWSVGVFERNAACGGAVRTEDVTLPGFRHDLGAMNLSLFAGSEFHRDYAADLAAAGLEFSRVTDCFASVFDDRWFGVSRDVETNVSRLAAFSSKDAVAWRELTERFPEQSAPILRLLTSSMTGGSLAVTAGRMLWSQGFAGTLETAKFLLSSSRSWLEDTFETPEVRATLAAWGMHLDFSPDIAGGALFPYLEAMASQAFGMVLGKGGAASMIRAIEGLVTGGGGAIHTDAEVTEIIVSSGKALGVQLLSGERIEARKAVIASVAPTILANRLLPEGSGHSGFDKAMRRFRHAPGAMVVHVAASELPRWRAGEELRRFGYVHIAPSLDQMAATYQSAVAGMLPQRPVLVVGQPTAVDPNRAPDGRHVLWIMVRAVPSVISGDADGTIEARDWSEAKEVYADRVFDLIEAQAPGFKASVLARAVFSPMDLQAMNPNLVGGDAICGSHHLLQNFVFRPALGYANGMTPIARLHMLGAAVWPGAGVGAGSGYRLARQLAGQ